MSKELNPKACKKNRSKPSYSIGLTFRQESLQLRKRPHPTHLHRRMRHVKGRLLRRVGVVRGPVHGHQGVARLRVVVKGDGGQQRERPGRAQAPLAWANFASPSAHPSIAG